MNSPLGFELYDCVDGTTYPNRAYFVWPYSVRNLRTEQFAAPPRNGENMLRERIVVLVRAGTPVYVATDEREGDLFVWRKLHVREVNAQDTKTLTVSTRKQR